MRTALVSFVSFVAVSAPLIAHAQLYETIGIRAQGMGGAFVAVADDATATWWNPAGLASGAYFDTIIEYDLAREPRVEGDASGAGRASWRTGSRGFAVVFPALGLSYYRMRVSEIRPIGPTGAAGAGREDQGHAAVRLSSLVLHQFGATVGQSVGEHLVVASTLKLVRGGFALAEGIAAEASLDRASELEGASETHGDLDVGIMAALGAVRVGVVVKNIREPAFESGAGRVELGRQARAGVSVVLGNPRIATGITLAVDADLTRTPTAVGDVRHIAAGAEAWMLGRQVAVRGGISANTVGETRPAAAAGVSVAVRSGVYWEGQVTRGADRSRYGWGTGVRLTF